MTKYWTNGSLNIKNKFFSFDHIGIIQKTFKFRFSKFISKVIQLKFEINRLLKFYGLWQFYLTI